MKFKKVTALLMATMMVAACLAGCGKEEEKQPASNSSEDTAQTEETTEAEETVEDESFSFPLKESVTISVFKKATVEENTVLNHWMEETNVELELIEVPEAEMNEKGSLLVGSGDYPDVFWGGVDAVAVSGENGILLPLQDLIKEYAPNLTAALDEKNAWDVISDANGNIYMMPIIGGSSTVSAMNFIYNEVFLENLGLEMPTNGEELYNCLKAIKENDANKNGDPDDEVPLRLASDGYFSIFALTPFMCTEGLVAPFERVSVKDGVMTFLPAEDEFKEFLKEMKKWYAEGLMNQDCFTLSQNDIWSFFAAENNTGFTFAEPEYTGTWKNQYAYVDPFKDSPGIAVTSGVYQNGIVITDACEHPEVAVAFFDKLYTQQGMIESMYGEEGIDWEFDGDGYLQQLNEKGHMENSNSTGDNRKLAAVLRPADRALGGVMETQLHYLERAGAPWATISWMDEYLTAYCDPEALVRPYVDNYVANVIIGEIDVDATWEDYKAELIAMGANEMVTAYNHACGDIWTTKPIE